jgi:hypothetical protein
MLTGGRRALLPGACAAVAMPPTPVPATGTSTVRLVRRPEADVLPIPATEAEWQTERAAARGLDLTKVL